MQDVSQIATRDLTKVSRRILTKPVIVAFFASVPIVFTLYAKPPDGMATLAPQRVFWNVVICAIMYLVCYTTAGWFITAAARRGWPLISGLILMILLATALLVTVGMTLLFTNPYMSTLLRVSGISIFLGVLGTVMIVEANKAHILGAVRKHFPSSEIYKQRSRAAPIDQMHDVQAMVAQNQYTLVQRPNNEELVRRPLTEMVDLMPSDVGFQIHRSHWIRAERIAKVVYRNGNPKLVDVDGQEIPIGRKSVPQVKAYLSLRKD